MTHRPEPPKKDAQLPTIALDPEFNEEVRAYAKQHKLALAKLVRLSLAFYLSRNSAKNGNLSVKSGKKKAKAS